ncbi:MAG: hypothetical protein DRJ42_26320 [Deltaproteobacteria bacterium]|nr:MAG: hypothetical protein DRJ42_26320 [Deltaproteobacteria bacterium]
MTRALTGAWLVFAVTAWAPSVADAQEGEGTTAEEHDGDLGEALRGGLDTNVWLVEAQLGIAGSIVERGPQVTESDGAPLGVLAAFTTGLRTDYFVTPAIDIAYYGLGRSTDRVVDPSGAEGVIDNRLQLATVSFGLLVDLWRFRIRFGTGAFHLALDTRTGGVEAETSRWDFGWLLGIAGYFYRDEGRQLGFEGRVAIDAGSDIVVLTLGLVATVDALSF